MDVADQKKGSKPLNEVEQSKDGNPLIISSMDVEKVLQVKCSEHPKKNAEFIHLVPDVVNPRICNLCVKQKKILEENKQDIRKILLGSNEENDLISYPVLTDPELNERIQAIGDGIEDEKEPIDEYFQELTKMMEAIIERRKQDHKMKLIQLEGLFQRFADCRADIMELENLQRILLQNDNVKLSDFIRNHISKAATNTQKIQTIFNQFQTLKDEFSVDRPSKIKKLVCDLLDEINFFSVSGTDSSPLKAIEESDEYRNALQKKQQALEDSQSQVNQSQKTILEMQLLINELKRQNESFSKENTDLKQECSNLQQKVTLLEEENGAIKQQSFGEKQEISVLKQQINGETESKANLNRELEKEQKSTPSLNQQLFASKEQQQQQSTSSLVVFNEYTSLIQQGVDRNILTQERPKSLCWSDTEQKQYMYYHQDRWHWRVKQSPLDSYKYVEIYEEWQKLDEGERRQQLKILKKEVKISN